MNIFIIPLKSQEFLNGKYTEYNYEYKENDIYNYDDNDVMVGLNFYIGYGNQTYEKLSDKINLEYLLGYGAHISLFFHKHFNFDFIPLIYLMGVNKPDGEISLYKYDISSILYYDPSSLDNEGVIYGLGISYTIATMKANKNVNDPMRFNNKCYYLLLNIGYEVLPYRGYIVYKYSLNDFSYHQEFGRSKNHELALFIQFYIWGK